MDQVFTDIAVVNEKISALDAAIKRLECSSTAPKIRENVKKPLRKLRRVMEYITLIAETEAGKAIKSGKARWAAVNLISTDIDTDSDSDSDSRPERSDKDATAVNVIASSDRHAKVNMCSSDLDSD